MDEQRPCLGCKWREGEAGCAQVRLGLTPGWPEHGGIIYSDHYALPYLCPRREAK